MPFAVGSKQGSTVSIFVQAYQASTNRSWQVMDTYSSGMGFVASALELPYSEEKDWTIDTSYNKHNLGNLTGTKFTYSGNFTAIEKENIEWTWEKARASDLLESTMQYADQGWEISVPKLLVPGPFYIEHIH
jgi:hypothetical protein